MAEPQPEPELVPSSDDDDGSSSNGSSSDAQLDDSGERVSSNHAVRGSAATTP